MSRSSRTTEAQRRIGEIVAFAFVVDVIVLAQPAGEDILKDDGRFLATAQIERLFRREIVPAERHQQAQRRDLRDAIFEVGGHLSH